MKLNNIIRTIIILLMIAGCRQAFADPLDPGGGPGGDPVSGDAPIGGGSLILITSAIMYAWAKSIKDNGR